MSLLAAMRTLALGRELVASYKAGKRMCSRLDKPADAHGVWGCGCVLTAAVPRIVASTLFPVLHHAFCTVRRGCVGSVGVVWCNE